MPSTLILTTGQRTELEQRERSRRGRTAKARLEANGRFRKPVVTQIEAFSEFWRAEGYHQRYLEKRGLGQCHI
jgi:peptide-methionine (S)-S-oxide reductase